MVQRSKADLRSAAVALTLTVTVAVLLAGSGSGVLAEAVAVSLSDVLMPPWTVTTIVMVVCAPLARLARLQTTVPVAPTTGVVHVQPGAVIDVNVLKLGRVSTT